MAHSVIKNPVTIEQIRAERELDLDSYKRVAKLESKSPREVIRMLPATCDEKERGKILTDFLQMVRDGKVDWMSVEDEELLRLGYITLDKEYPNVHYMHLPLQWYPEDISEYFAEKSTPACNPGFEKEDRTAYSTEKSLREIEKDQKVRRETL